MASGPSKHAPGLGSERTPGPFRMAGPPAGEEVEIGYVSGIFGVRGEVRLHLHHRESPLLDDGHDVVLVDSKGGRWGAHLRSRAGAGKRILGRFRTQLTREQAADLKGWTIRVLASALPTLDEGEFWVWQLEGVDVRVDGTVVGTVVTVHATGPVDVFEVRITGEREPVFVPALTEWVIDAGPMGLVLRALP